MGALQCFCAMTTKTFTIRATTKGDIAAVDALLARSYPALLKADYPPSLLVTAIPLISKAQPNLVTSGRYFGVFDADGALAGAGGMTLGAPKGYVAGAGIAHVRHVVTDHRRTREGIGRVLMEHLFTVAIDDGARRLHCLSTRTAVPFYSALGFERLRPVTVPLRPGIDFPSVLMHRAV